MYLHDTHAGAATPVWPLDMAIALLRMLWPIVYLAIALFSLAVAALFETMKQCSSALRFRAVSVSVFGVGIGIRYFLRYFSCRFCIRYRYFEIPRYSVSVSVFLKYWLKIANFWYPTSIWRPRWGVSDVRELGALTTAHEIEKRVQKTKFKQSSPLFPVRRVWMWQTGWY